MYNCSDNNISKAKTTLTFRVGTTKTAANPKSSQRQNHAWDWDGVAVVALSSHILRALRKTHTQQNNRTSRSAYIPMMTYASNTQFARGWCRSEGKILSHPCRYGAYLLRTLGPGEKPTARHRHIKQSQFGMRSRRQDDLHGGILPQSLVNS